MNLFLRTLLGNLVLRTLLGNLFPGTLPGNPWLANLFLETCFATLLGNLFLGTLLGNCFWNPCLGTLPGNLFLGTWLGNRSWQPCLRTCTVPKNGSQARPQEPFPSKVPSRNKARRNRFSSKRSPEELVPKQNFQVRTSSWEPCLRTAS